HLSLASFPTRRSSDLSMLRMAAWPLGYTFERPVISIFIWSRIRCSSREIKIFKSTLYFKVIMDILYAQLERHLQMGGVRWVRFRSEEHTSELQSRENL